MCYNKGCNNAYMTEAADIQFKIFTIIVPSDREE